jgi:putative DNA primase/helicase
MSELDEMRAVVENLNKKIKELGAPGGAKWFSTEIIPEVNKHYAARLASGVHIIYRIKDNGVIERHNADGSLLHDIYALILAKNGNKPVAASVAGQAAAQWKLAGREFPAEEPALVLFKSQDPDQLTYNRLSFDPAEGEWSAWKEFDTRLTHPEVWRAYVWSVFEPKNKGRQIVWLHGEGQDGKSVVLRVLSDLLGNNGACGISNAQTKNPQFLSSLVYGKALVIYPDCKNEKFVMGELVRNWTSGDTIPIEQKHQPIFSAPVRVKLIVGSNSSPDLTSGRADLSRLIYLPVKSSEVLDDSTWGDKLTAQLPSYLWQCRESYQKLCPKNGNIALPPDLVDAGQILAEEFEEEFQAVYDANFALCMTSGQERENCCQHKPTDIFCILNREWPTDTIKVKRFKVWMKSKGLGKHVHTKTHNYYTWFWLKAKHTSAPCGQYSPF